MDPDDPTVIAENELLGAAASIDAAAKKLASLRPRRSFKVRRDGRYLFGSASFLGTSTPTTSHSEICLIFLVVTFLNHPRIKHIITEGGSDLRGDDDISTK